VNADRRRCAPPVCKHGGEIVDKKIEMKKVKKVVVNKLNTRTGIKALGGSASNNSCTGELCYTQ
jgi:hypothetical protein